MDQKEYKAKKRKLAKAKRNLKKHFVGIDDVIDRVFSTIEVWYLMPELLTRPIIINLWGLTGSGKTDLVRRLVDELDFDEKFSEVQLSTSANGGYYTKSISSSLGYMGIKPEDQAILLLDEIQRFSHKNEEGNSKDIDDYQDIWMLLSDGQLSTNNTYKANLLSLLWELEFDLDREQNSEDDDVDEDDEIPEDGFGRPRRNKKKKAKVSKFTMGVWSAERFKEKTECEDSVRDIMTWDTKKKISVVQKLMRSPKRRSDKKFKNLLVFICGNLDSAYSMSNDVAQTNVDADILHEFSKKISVVRIKDCLLKHFKPEQISRFGNNHIIYPSLSKESFNEIIEHGLIEISKRIKDVFDIELEFTEDVKKAVYRNGVYPAQGVRPLFSTLSSLIEATVPNFLMPALVAGEKKVVVDIDEEGSVKTMVATVNKKKIKQTIHLDIDTIMENVTADEIARVATHEAGHAVAYALLYKMAPAQIVCNTTKLDSNGFVMPHEILASKQFTEQHIQTYLAGKAAEQLVFGDGWATAGCSADYNAASNYAGRAIRQWGMYENMFYTTTGQAFTEVRGKISTTDEDIENLLRNEKANIDKLLKDNQEFLKEIIALIQEKQRVLPEEFVAVAKKYVPEIKVKTADFTVSHDFKGKLDEFLAEKDTPEPIGVAASK